MARKRGKQTKGFWSKDDLRTLKRMFANNTTRDVADKLGRPLTAVKKKASRMGLKKTKKHIRAVRRG